MHSLVGEVTWSMLLTMCILIILASSSSLLRLHFHILSSHFGVHLLYFFVIRNSRLHSTHFVSFPTSLVVAFLTFHHNHNQQPSTNMLFSRSQSSSGSSSGPKFPPPRAVASRRLNKSRHVTLPYLCALSLATLILATIYAYCVHQNNHHRAAILNGTAGTRSTSANTPSPPTTADQVILIFYSATLPLLSLLHTLIEGTLLKWAPQVLTRTTSTTTKSPSSSRKPHPSLPTHFVIPQTKRTSLKTPLVLLSTHTLLLSGWVVTSAFWTHCELALTSAAVCPAPVRDHLMYGIYELSIAKSALGWAVALGYGVHLALLLRWVRTVWRWEGLKRGLDGVKGAEGLWEEDGEEEGGCAGGCACGGGRGGRGGSSVTGSLRSVSAAGSEEDVEWRGKEGGKTGFGVIRKEGEARDGGKKGVTVVTVSVDEGRSGSSASREQGEEGGEGGQQRGPPKVVPFFPPPPKRPVRS